MNDNELKKLKEEINKFISHVAFLWKQGFPNNGKKPYQFKEIEYITNNRLVIKIDLNGRRSARLDNKFIGYCTVIYDDEDLTESHMLIVFNKKYELIKDFIIPTEVMVDLYDILLKILEEDPKSAKFRFEKLGFQEFYERKDNEL